MSENELETGRAGAQPSEPVESSDVGADGPANVDRRKFLRSAAKAGVVAPPAMVALLSTTMSSPAIAGSGGEQDVPNEWNRKKLKCYNAWWTGWRTWCVWW